MTRLVWFKNVLLIFALFICVNYAQSNELTALQVTTVSSSTVRAIVAMKYPVKYHTIYLHHQPRLVLDLPSSWLRSAQLLKIHQNAFVKAVRHAEKKGGVLRLVFDLTQPLSVKVRQDNQQGHRLIIDFSAAQKAKQIPGRKIVVLIDPGHGGKDPGAIGLHGTAEKKVVLNIARQLQQDINQQPGFIAKLTRYGDYYLSLRERLLKARKAKADLFVAIHADAYRGRTAHGASVFALSLRGATSEAARWVAKRENESELMGGVMLADKSNILKSVLLNLSQMATIRSSLRIGKRIMMALGNVGQLHHQKVEQAAFVVLKSPDIPSLLVETGFITTPSEEKKLTSPLYQRRLAFAMMQGIRNYFAHWPPRGTWLSQQPMKVRKANKTNL